MASTTKSAMKTWCGKQKEHPKIQAEEALQFYHVDKRILRDKQRLSVIMSYFWRWDAQFYLVYDNVNTDKLVLTFSKNGWLRRTKLNQKNYKGYCKREFARLINKLVAMELQKGIQRISHVSGDTSAAIASNSLNMNIKLNMGINI